METAIYVFSGFLGSGKTLSIQETILKTFTYTGKTSVIICTEEGEYCYRKDALKDVGIEVVEVEYKEDFNEAFLERIKKVYDPLNVYIEYNGMWDVEDLIKMKKPEGWYIETIFGLVDSTTYSMYLKNMRQMIMTPLRSADVVIFNRCDDLNKGEVRRQLKILNGRAEVFFIKKDGSVDNNIEDLIFTTENGILHITDDIFCSWFVDCLENSDKYYGKTVRFKGMVTDQLRLMKGQFFLGRKAAICCEADASLVGFISELDDSVKDIYKIPSKDDWIEMDAEITKGEVMGNKAIIILKVKKMEKIETPENEFLYF
ncbi:MAG: GTPase [Eubacterium sp.]|nr:GTPase [Eubacterium sp.]